MPQCYQQINNFFTRPTVINNIDIVTVLMVSFSSWNIFENIFLALSIGPAAKWGQNEINNSKSKKL